jgi:osmotically-inducible protein OsmY
MQNAIKRIGGLFALGFLLGACAGSPTSKSTGQYIDDAAIGTKVKAALIQSPETKAGQIDVDVYKGVVQLSGFVDNEAEATEAQRIASNVAGVRRVENKLSIR